MARKVSVKKVRVRHVPTTTKPQQKHPGLGLPKNTKRDVETKNQ